jgi:Ricin-type beta-trefoil lectin domain/Cytolethal distending toxin A/C domain
MITLPTFISANFGVNKSIEASVQCVDSSADGTFSVVIGYKSNIARKELTSSKLSPNRPVIHTYFDRLDKNTLDFNDPNIATKLSGPITYFKGISNSQTIEQKAMVIQGQGTETINWEFVVDGKTYTIYANKDYAVKCQKPTVQTIDGNAAANLIPPVDPKYIVYEYSNIFNNDNNYFLATENEYNEAGSEVKFYSTATRNVNKPTSLWYYDSNTFQIKSKVNNMCIHKEQYIRLQIQICNVKDLAQKFEIGNFNNDVTKPQLKLKSSTKCFDFNIFAQDINGAATIQESVDCDGNIKQVITIKKGTGTEAVGSPTTFSSFAPTQFKLQLVDCLSTAKLYFPDAIVESRNQDNTVTSVRVKFQGVDRIISCDDIVKMQSLDLTTTTNSDIDNNLSLYNMIKIRGGMNFLDTINGSGLPGTIAVTGRSTYDRTNKSQNWFYDTETQEIKSAYQGLCLGPVQSQSVNYVGLVVCDKKLVTSSTKWRIIKNTNQNYTTSGGDSMIQMDGTNLCLAGEFIPKIANGVTTQQDDYWLTQRMVTRECPIEKAVNYGSQLIEILSKIDTRDISLIALENDRLQRLYNGSTPAKDTSTFGTIEHISGGIVLSADTTNNVKIDNSSQVFVRPLNPAFRQNWKYNSTTKQIYLERNELCLGQIMLNPDSSGDIAGLNASKCNTLDNKQLWNVMKMADGNFMIQSVLNKGCIDLPNNSSRPVIRIDSCGTGKWKGGIANYSTAFPVIKVSIPLINILSDINTNGKRYGLDVKAGTVGAGSELFMWENTATNTNQMFAHNPDTNEIYYNPSKTTEPTNQKVTITDPTDPTKKIEVPVFVKNFADAMTCLDAGDATTGSVIKINPCNGNINQKWSFELQKGVNGNKNMVIKNLSKNQCLDAEGAFTNPSNNMYNGRKAIVWTCGNDFINQRFRKYEKGQLLAKKTPPADLNLSQIANFEELTKILNSIAIEATSIQSTSTDLLTSSVTNPSKNACFTDLKQGKLTCTLPENIDSKLSIQALEKTTIEAKNTTTGKSDSINKFLEKNNIKNRNDLNKNSKSTSQTSSKVSIEVNNNLAVPKVSSSKPDNMLVDPNNLPGSIKRILEKSPEAKISKSENNPVLGFLNQINPFKSVTTIANAPTVGIYEIQLFQISNWVMDIAGQSSADQTKVQLWDRNNTSAQKWLWNSSTGEIKGIAGKCLDSGGGNLGDTLRIHTCHGGWNQKWAFRIDYTMTQSNPNIGRDTCASLQGDSAYPGAPLIVNDCGLNACNKYWNYVGASGYDRTRVPTVCGGISPTPPPAQPQQSPPNLGTKIIANLFNKNSVFDIYGNNSANQTAVTMYSRSGNINQKFSYYTDGKIRALAGKCLDSGSGNLGDWIRINDCTGGWNQKWNVNRDYSINQVNGNNNQTYCIGTDNGATNGNPRLVLKSCANINDCSTYWEIENISDYSPSLVYAQGCGSFSNGSNNNNPTPSTPPSYTPPSPTPTPNPGTGGGTSTPNFDYTNSPYYKPEVARRLSVNASYLSNGYSEVLPDWSIVNTKATEAVNSLKYEVSNITNGVSPCLNILTSWGCNETSQFKASSNKLISFVAGLIVGAGNGYAIDFVIGQLTAAIKFNVSAFLAATVVVLAFVDWSLNNVDFYLYVVTDSLDSFAKASIYEKGYIIGFGIYTLFGVVKVAISLFQEVLDGLTRLINAGRQGASNIVKTTSKLSRYFNGKPLRSNTPNIKVATINSVPSVYTNQLLSTTQTEANIAIKSIKNELTTVTYQQIQNDLASISDPTSLVEVKGIYKMITSGDLEPFPIAQNLQEQIVLKKAFAGDGQKIIDASKMGDTRLANKWSKYEVKEYYKDSLGYTRAAQVHYIRNIENGAVADFKFANHQTPQ